MTQQEFLDKVRNLSEYWANVPDKSKQDALDGLAFSILNLFDGTSLGCPALKIVVEETGEVVNDIGSMHEFYYE